MDVTVKTSKNERAYFVKGVFSAGDEDRFYDVFLQIRAMTEPCLAFDLSLCPSVDPAAMGMLVVAAQEAARRNIARVIRRAPASVREVLLSAGFEKFYVFQ